MSFEQYSVYFEFEGQSDLRTGLKGCGDKQPVYDLPIHGRGGRDDTRTCVAGGIDEDDVVVYL